MPRYALVRPNDTVARLAEDVDPNVQTKSGWRWMATPNGSPPTFDPKTERLTGPTYSIGSNSVTESWTKVSLSTQEISDAKDAAVAGLNGSTYQAQLQILLSLENEIRELRTKVNAVIDAAGVSATVPKFTGGQSNSINLNQLKNAIKGLLS